MNNIQQTAVVQIPAVINFHQSLDDEVGASLLFEHREQFIEAVRDVIMHFVADANVGATRQYISVSLSPETFITRLQEEPIAQRFARA